MITERQLRALVLRLEPMSYAAIAAELGVSRPAARKLCAKAVHFLMINPSHELHHLAQKFAEIVYVSEAR